MNDERESKKQLLYKIEALEQSLLELKNGATPADQDKLRAFANASPDVMLIMDKKGTYVDILTSQNQLLVSEPKDLIGKNVYEVLSKDEADTFIKNIKQTLKAESPLMVEYELTVQGGRKWFEGRSSKVNGIEESLVVFVTRDITERKQTEEVLREAEEKYREFIEGTDNLITQVDSKGNFTYVN